MAALSSLLSAFSPALLSFPKDRLGLSLPSPLTPKPMESSENHTRDLPPPPAGETPTPAPTGTEGTRFQNHVPSGTYFGLARSHLNSWGIVLTTFVIQTSQNMQPDYNEASMLLLFKILKATTSNGSQLVSIPSSPTNFFFPSCSDEWTNSLWFMSLTLSLVTALITILVKQWLHQYIAIISDSSTHDHARIQHLRWRLQERRDRQERQESLFSFPKMFPTLKEIEHGYIQQHAMMTDVQSLVWLYSSTSNVSVHQSLLQAISGMTPDTMKCLPDKYISIFVVSLCQQITSTTSLALSSGTDINGKFNEKFTMALCSLCSKSSEEASVAFLEILQSPHRSSLMLHPAVWKTLFDTIISSPVLSHSALQLELEFMKILAKSTTPTSEREDPTTIDNLTDEIRRYMCDKLLACWGYDWSQSPNNIHLGIMFSLMPWIHQRLLNSSHALDQKEVMETALTIIKGIFSVFWGITHLTTLEEVLNYITRLFSLLSSEFETSGVDADVDIFACGISMAFITAQSQWIECFSTGGRAYEIEGKIIEIGVDRFINITLLLIDRHHEHILYAWVEGKAWDFKTYVWGKYVEGLIQWVSGQEFCCWTFLKRVLAIVVIRELQTRIASRYCGGSLPEYDYEVHMEVEQLPWLLDIYSPSLSSDRESNPLEYSKIIGHPKFQEFLNAGQLSQEACRTDVEGNGSEVVLLQI
ncbi:hypothetical protein F5146DRAFT_1007713 [Armillaria mellea]|nr:hypothetical protein F5146DRAFT_1007713 [Armillaria mellea]